MASKEKRQGSLSTGPADCEMRVAATYRRGEETVLTRTQFFDETTSLHDLLRWAREAENMDVALAGLEIEVSGSDAS
ncbi:MAG: hypothetical protein OEU92_26500 [Alphaproteobacteria bacterium]|nr:hypothetical protein [Alphaproteobacteria bacterium]